MKTYGVLYMGLGMLGSLLVPSAANLCAKLFAILGCIAVGVVLGTLNKYFRARLSRLLFCQAIILLSVIAVINSEVGSHLWLAQAICTGMIVYAASNLTCIAIACKTGRNETSQFG